MENEQIIIQGLQVFGYHGVYQQEQENGQFFHVDLICDVLMGAAAKSDDLDKTVNYGILCYFIRDYFQKHRFQLIETVANELIQELFFAFPDIRGMKLTIQKPNAPIQMDFDTVGVTIAKKWHKVAVSLGSNMGDKKEHLIQGVAGIKSIPQIKNLKESNIYTTKPYGYIQQEDFLNMAVVFETFLSPKELLEQLQIIEQAHHRTREIHWGPRTLDLDILLYDDLIYDSDELIIPHIDMCNRLFVLKPLDEIAPYFLHPLENKRISQLLQQWMQTQGKKSKEKVKKYDY